MFHMRENLQSTLLMWRWVYYSFIFTVTVCKYTCLTLHCPKGKHYVNMSLLISKKTVLCTIWPHSSRWSNSSNGSNGVSEEIFLMTGAYIDQNATQNRSLTLSLLVKRSCCCHDWDYSPQQEHATVCCGRTSLSGTTRDYKPWGRVDTPKQNKL